MREQIASLQAEITDAIGTALKALAPPAKKPFSGRKLRIVDGECINAKGRYKKDEGACPEIPKGEQFVVVLTKQ